MAHFAQLNESNIVTQVIVVNNEVINNAEGLEGEAEGIAFCQSLYGADTKWVQCSYNGNFRFRYPSLGMLYDSVKDAFYLPKPKGLWYWNEATLNWEETDPDYPSNWYWTRGASAFFDRNMGEFVGLPNLRFLEIGSWVGTSAIEQVKNFLTGDNSTITCVDIWDDPKVEEYFGIRTLPYSDKITKVKSDSKTWLENNQGKRFDFIYIDGDHTAEAIESDTRLGWNMLKPNGIMALDDYLLSGETEQAINSFVESIKDESTIIDKGFQVWLQKK